MKLGTISACAAFAFLLFISPARLPATEIEVDFSFSNFEFAPDRTPGEDEDIGDQLAYEGGFSLRNALAENLFLDAGLERDAILGNTVLSALRVREGVLEVAIGPTFGVLNSRHAPVRAGVMGSIDLTIFDRLLFETEARETLAVVTDEGDYRSGLLAASAGLKVENAVVRVNMDTRRFDERSDGEILRRRRTKYGVSADVFKEGVPYSVLIDLGYVTRELRQGDSDEDSDILSSVVLGLEVTANVTERIDYYAGANMSLFSSGRDALTGRNFTAIPLYHISTGLSFDLDR